MPSLVTAAVLVFTSLLPAVLAQDENGASTDIPLASQTFQWSNLPYQIDTDALGRGPQYGYNICNSTTEGPDSKCQTAVINSIDDFCLWGPPEANQTVGETEGESVAYCTKAGHGTRIIPQGALTGVQFMKTSAYIQVTGWIKQEYIDLQVDDSGGELDPHGADQRGNPLGGVLFSTAWGAGSDGSEYKQAREWHSFMGGGQFCLKACDPAGADAANYCQHIFDRIGCAYNAPADYKDGEFTSCLGDNQDFPGVYTGTDGVVSTYSQPPESLGPISTMPYQPRVPASSQCTTYTSAQLYAGLPTPSFTLSPTATASTSRSGAALPSSSHHTTTGSHTTTTSGASPRTVVSVGALAGAAVLAAFVL